MSSSPARNRISLPRSTNKITKEHDRLMATEEFIDIFNKSIKKSFPQLDNVFILYSRLEGLAHDKYGDYVCMNILTICESLRSSDPHLFDHMPTEVIARKLLKAVRKHPKSKTITQIRLHDVGFLTFKLSPKWMIKRIKKMINEGMDTWAPIIYRESVVVDGPAPDIAAYRHAEEIRSRYIKEMLICMLDYSGVDVGTSLTNKESRDAVGEYFAEKRGEITSKRHKTSLFTVKRGHKPNSFCEDLQTLWSAIFTLRGRLVVYVTPIRRREYVNKCFDAATDEEWVLVESSVRCCGYRTTSYVAGYTREASMECAIKYTYLKTHRLAECTLNIDEILDEEGNTFVCLLKTLVFFSSLPENLGGGVMAFFNKERELALHLVQFTEVIEKACLKFLLHPVCEYIWILCKKFTSYYNEVMKFLDLRTYKLKFFLCDATKLVMGKCFHLLGITPESSRESSRVPKVKTGFEINPYFPSNPRPNNINPRFEMFCMNIAVADSSFKKGDLHGIVSLVDADGLLSDGRLPLNRNDHGHVAYFYREWYDTIGICNNAYVYFGSPSPCHLVPFSSALEIYVRLFVTTADKCFQMCNCLETIKLSESWDEQLDHKR
ncbi:arginine--tRNA ligase, chloroplastic/mitochondrial, partial [Tanacetum coccineum]